MLFLKRIKKLFVLLFNLKKYFNLEREVQKNTREIIFLREMNAVLKIDKYKLLAYEQKIKVIFLAQEISLWPVFQAVYSELKNSPSFEVTIVLAPKYFCGKWCKEDYQTLKNFFNKNSIAYADGILSTSGSTKNHKIIELKDLNPHYVFYTCPYMEDYHETQRCDYVDLFAHVCYIPYGFLLADQPKTQYNQQIHHIAHKIFCETEYHKSNYCLNAQNGKNVIVTGYTKFDLLGSLHIPAELKRIREEFTKIVIVAPHWSIGNLSRETRFGTFDEYINVIQALPQRYPQIFFIFKPHPSLRDAFQRGNILSSNEYDHFLIEWSSHKNTMHYEGANYFRHFYISDALITDSVSFLAEYILLQKPLLLLKRPDASPYNDIGKEIERSSYKALNKKDIEEFFKNILFSENDPLKENRASLLKTIKPFKELACIKIRQELEKSLRG